MKQLKCPCCNKILKKIKRMEEENTEYEIDLETKKEKNTGEGYDNEYYQCPKCDEVLDYEDICDYI